jgi:thioredoxin-dependent peroxiredoxin
MSEQAQPRADGLLKVGDRAPGFRLTADDGQPVTLDDWRGKRVVLYVSPKALTPG